jgi:hypothetical protein
MHALQMQQRTRWQATVIARSANSAHLPGYQCLFKDICRAVSAYSRGNLLIE